MRTWVHALADIILTNRSILKNLSSWSKLQIIQKRTLAGQKVHHDPYKLAQIKLRKEANLSRQRELLDQRTSAMGDPVRGISTPYLETFDNVDGSAEPGAEPKLLNHFLTPSELETSIENSKFLSSPIIPVDRQGVDPVNEELMIAVHEAQHQNAMIAINKIVSLSNANSKDKMRANITRCIDKFGRHNTDKYLKPRPPVNPSILKKKVMPEKTPRAGPDTGSSEVQIAILTAKIRVLANELEKPGGKKDKINKRNLRLLVHKRQKLLKYLNRKERGGERWQNLVETLGLTNGTWKGEISL
ncbi:putative ribosomal protein s15 [Golovinomyces cichoracearum]|uniref:Putative ribosomal protein s15 n=1 Tax=Golovinomyces cichoracearum TaxID=62708 RepID=A0A420J622_9PEZI|nr:putative ribosomal protein s15 [Golovinomyces cichoracearum]